MAITITTEINKKIIDKLDGFFNWTFTREHPDIKVIKNIIGKKKDAYDQMYMCMFQDHGLIDRIVIAIESADPSYGPYCVKSPIVVLVSYGDDGKLTQRMRLSVDEVIDLFKPENLEELRLKLIAMEI